MQTFDAATALERSAPGSFSWTVPDGWHVGRGAWGGLIVGALIRAVTACEDDAVRTVRSVSAELVAPALVGDITIATRLLRAGSGLSSWEAAATDPEGALVARLTAVLARPRESSADLDYSTWRFPAPPEAPSAEQVPVVPIAPPFGPEFAQQMEMRPLHGIPATGESADVLGYIRFLQPVSHTAASLIALVDGWWPATLTAIDRMRPIATVNFSSNLVVDPASIAPDELLLHHGMAAGASDGFASEHRQLWTSDGRLAVDNLQSIVLIA